MDAKNSNWACRLPSFDDVPILLYGFPCEEGQICTTDNMLFQRV